MEFLLLKRIWNLCTISHSVKKPESKDIMGLLDDSAFIRAANNALKDRCGLQGQGCGAGFPGTLTIKSTINILNHLDIGKTSHLFDAGAGIGRPLVVGSVIYGVKEAWGVEVDSCVVMQANAFLPTAVQRLAQVLTKFGIIKQYEEPQVPFVINESIEMLQPHTASTHITHVYLFAPGMSGAHGQSIYQALAPLMATANHLEAVAIVRHSRDSQKIITELEDAGWRWPNKQLTIKHIIPGLKQMGSSAAYTGYIVGFRSHTTE